MKLKNSTCSIRSTWTWMAMVGILVSFWDGQFSGAKLYSILGVELLRFYQPFSPPSIHWFVFLERKTNSITAFLYWNKHATSTKHVEFPEIFPMAHVWLLLLTNNFLTRLKAQNICVLEMLWEKKVPKQLFTQKLVLSCWLKRKNHPQTNSQTPLGCRRKLVKMLSTWVITYLYWVYNPFTNLFRTSK